MKLYTMGEINTTMELNFLLIFFIINLSTILALLVCVYNWRLAKQISLVGGFLQFFTFIGMYAKFVYPDADKTQFDLYFTLAGPYIPIHLGVDGLSLWFVFLTLLLLPICILCGWDSIKQRVVEFHIILHLITFMLMLVFTTQNLLLFYIAFESVLIPMFVIIGVWGSRERKMHATYQFFLFTLVGSVMMLIAIIYMYATCGSTELSCLVSQKFVGLPASFMWVAIFIALAVKVPMFPVHIWLPEAHVEAPTAGSVLLAGILLKMGGYGYLKFLLPVFPTECHTFKLYVLVLALIGVGYSTLTTIRQIDLKKIVAYSSVSHMNYAVVGLVVCTLSSLEGAVLTMIGHGFVSSALFICVGSLYERHGTRVLYYYSGLVNVVPIFSLYFLMFTLANVSLPGTSNFTGELLIFIGVYPYSSFVAIFLAIMTLFSAVYSFWLYNRLMFGRVKLEVFMLYSDLNKREKLLVGVLLFYTLLMGVCPSIFLEAITPYIVKNLQSC